MKILNDKWIVPVTIKEPLLERQWYWGFFFGFLAAIIGTNLT